MTTKTSYHRQFRDTRHAAQYFASRNYKPLSGPDDVLMRPIRHANGKRIMTFATQETPDTLIYKFVDIVCKPE
jgi:hypothetical protein